MELALNVAMRMLEVYTHSWMDRVNSEGIKRESLAWVLTRRDLVLRARRTGSCLLCCQGPVHEAGLCDVCTVMLTEIEMKLVERWMAGVGP